MKVVEHAKENPGMYTIVAALVTMLGGSVALKIEMPADKAIAEVKVEIAQNYEMREKQYEQQQQLNAQEKVDDIEFRMEQITEEINRINQIPVYLNRPLTSEEQWSIDRLKLKWSAYQQELSK